MLKPKATAFLCLALIAVSGLACYGGPVQTYTLNNWNTAPSSNGNGYLFTYESLVQSPGEEGGVVYTDWWYDYYLENNSLNLDIAGWVWSYGPYSGLVMPNSHPDAEVADGSSPLPIPKADGPSLDLAQYREEFFDDAAPYFQVNSTELPSIGV